MRTLAKWMLGLAMAAMLAGCAGTKFARPTDDQLRLGVTTEQEVLARMGPPSQQATGLSNGKATRMLVYAYATFGAQPRKQGVTPVNSVAMSFHEGKLVSYAYVSTLNEDATDFDDTKVAGIQAGKSKAADVIAALGKPPGQSIYPVVAQPDGRALVYSHQEMRGFTPSQKILTVVLDRQDNVVDVQFQNQGTWGK